MSRNSPRLTLTLRFPPLWLAFDVFLIVLVAGLVVLDKEVVHWYTPDQHVNSAKLSEASDRIDALESDLANVQSDMRDLRLARAVSSASTGLTDNPENSLARVSNALAVVSLVQSKGGQQSSGSAQGKACVAWLLRGEGSITDCGFTRTN